MASRGVASTLIFAFGLALLDACTSASAGPYVELKNKRFEIEIAADEASRERGLMFRDQLAADHGMLFLFEHPAVQTFWMKNTRIPLDILYFDANWKLISMQQRVPPCQTDPCPVYPSTGSAQYVLELNAGVADMLGVKAGDVLAIHH